MFGKDNMQFTDEFAASIPTLEQELDLKRDFEQSHNRSSTINVIRRRISILSHKISSLACLTPK
jgi:hypothetical protein